MSLLIALNNAYDRMALNGDVPPFGYSSEKIGFLISLDEDGAPACPPIDLRTGDGRKKTPPLLPVPQPTKRTSGVAPNFLWDKTSYVLGVTAGEGKRLVEEHAAFVTRHEEILDGSEDPGVTALLHFLRKWSPENFEAWDWPEEMKDQNIVFALESERRQGGDIYDPIYIHSRSAAQELWAKLSSTGDKKQAICLVSGDQAPIARLHPGIKGVWGAQSSGAALVSFNLDAFTSYGHEQGYNAPVSERAAFAYTAILNKFLEKGSPNRIQVGDASTVFWADGADAPLAEGIFSAIFGGTEEISEQSEARKILAILEKMRKGVPLDSFEPNLAKDVRFYVLGLSPNAARLSVRFWMEDSFGALARNYQRFMSDMALEPLAPRDENAPLWRYLIETAVRGKRENIAPNLAGDWLRSILTGTKYPLTLLSTILMRIRADKNITALRVAMLKAVLIRNKKMEVPMALDPDNTNKGYLLGRLFAVYENIQTAALGRKINATIKDKFYGSASAQPRKVFARLESGSVSHLSKLRKEKPGLKSNLEKAVGGIMALMSPDNDPFPASLSAEQQALFGLGYYHQRENFFSPSTPTPHEEESE